MSSTVAWIVLSRLFWPLEAVRRDDEVGKAKHMWELRNLPVGRNAATYHTSIYIISRVRLSSISHLFQLFHQRLVFSQITMPLTKQVILTDKAPKPLSVLNQG